MKLLVIAAVIAIHALPAFSQTTPPSPSGRPEELDASRFQEQEVWIPYWSEEESETSVLHLRNSLHHYRLEASIEAYSDKGELLVTRPLILERLENLDIPMASMVQSDVARSGSVRITYNYPYDRVLQAELSVRNDQHNHAYTIVGRRPYVGQVNSAYLPVQIPTPQTYLEIALLNPLEQLVGVQLSLRDGGEWKSIRTLSLNPRTNERIRVEPDVFSGSSEELGAWTALLKVDYSVTSTEMVTNAWMVDANSGFSNTALLHEDFPKSNRLYATQLVSRAFPAEVLADGPVLDGSLVFVNVDNSPSVLSGSLFCEIDSNVTEIPIPDFELQPFATEVVSLETLVMSRTAGSTVCSGEFHYSGRPGFVIGRYYAASQSKTYGLYIKLEPSVGRAYNEVYWSVQDEFSPLVTVTNFSDAADVITVSLTEADSLAELAKVTVPAHGSFTINVRERVTELRRTIPVKNDYGGLYVWAQAPTGRLLVKQHAINGRRAIMVPYYGIFEEITAHYFNSAPSSLYHTASSSASVTTCYSSSGCFNDHWIIDTTNASVLTVDNSGGAGVSRPVYGASPGTAQLTSGAYDYVEDEYVLAQNVQVQVKHRCYAKLKYREVAFNYNHAFWMYQRDDGIKWVTGAGPSNPICPGFCGDLENYRVQGEQGSISGDNASASTAWDSTLTSAVCSQVNNMHSFAGNWDDDEYEYDMFGCPNSNRYARWASNAAPFSPYPPPNAPCW